MDLRISDLLSSEYLKRKMHISALEKNIDAVKEPKSYLKTAPK